MWFTINNLATEHMAWGFDRAAHLSYMKSPFIPFGA